MLPLANSLFALILLAQNPPPAQTPPRTEPDRRDVPAAPAPDPQVDAWTAQLVARLSDPNRAIARSAEAGLIALGPMAAPALRKAADGNVPEVAERARHALEEIRLGPPPFRRRPGGPDGPPPGVRDGGNDRPWPPPFPREGRDRRDGPQSGNDTRDGRGPLPRDGGARNDDRRDGPPRDAGPGDDRRNEDRGRGEARNGARNEGLPPQGPRDRAGLGDRAGPRDRAGLRGAGRREVPPPNDRRRDGDGGDRARRDGPPPPDRGTPPPPRDDLRDAR